MYDLFIRKISKLSIELVMVASVSRSKDVVLEVFVKTPY